MYERVQKIFIAWAFNRYIAKDYFDNVNVNQLEVAIEKGEVELENLPIKQDALHHFDLPIDVVSGVVGKLTIKVPLLTFSSDPWSIKISNLTLNVARNGADSQSNSTLDENDSFSLNNSHFGTDLSEPDGLMDNPEGTKLAEFVSSLTATLSSMVKDIYKNIRLEIDSMTVRFNDNDHGLVKFSFDNLLLHRPRSDRNLNITNITLFLSSSINRHITNESNDLTRVRIDQCNIDITDESSNNMQLVIMQKQQNQEKSSNENNLGDENAPSSTCSEIKCEGYFINLSMDELIDDDKNGGDILNSLNKTSTNILNDTLNFQEPQYKAKRTILDCDKMRVEFKLSKNVEEESSIVTEKNLQMKFDLMGMRYTHSRRIYDVTINRLKNLRRYVLDMIDGNKKRMKFKNNDKIITSMVDKQKPTISNKLLIVNILDGLVYVVDDTPSKCAIPTLELSLDDFRILQFSGRDQHNGFVFAKVGCNYFNRESSYWDTFLHPWSFNLSWDFKSDFSTLASKVRNAQQRQVSLSSDEMADFVISNAFIDICDVSLKKIFLDFINPNNWPTRPNLNYDLRVPSQGFNSIFVLNNESGHKIYFAPMEQNSDLYEIHDPSKSLIISGGSGDLVNNTVVHKLSTTSRSSASSSQDSPELRSTRWIAVQPGESMPFEYETLPIYRRYVNDRCAQAKKRVIMIRVDGWKTLVPVVIDQTGTFYREALSDRVCYEDTHIAISIDLEGSTARKVISVRSPLKLVNSLNVTLEVHFFESNQAFYVKPEHHLAVPLPYLYNTIRIRPWNVGVTTSEQSISWDDIKWSGGKLSSKMFVCNPITVTNIKHASYCTSRSYRICVSVQQDKNDCQLDSANNSNTSELDDDGSNSNYLAYNSLPIYTLTFIAPLTIVNLLPCSVQYLIGDLTGELAMGNEQIVNYVDTTKPNDLFFKFDDMQSKPINIDPGATGSFSQIVEMIDEKKRSLYLKAKIILSSVGEEPAVRIIIFAQYWFLNKTGLPLIFKQEGAGLEAAGQFSKHEEKVKSILLFSFYDSELEPPWLCSMRLGMSQGASSWCDGFKLEKGSGERRINYVNKGLMMKHMIDIDVRKGFGRYAETTIVTFNVRHGFDGTAKTPRKAPIESPHNYKLTSYNHNTNLAERFAGQASGSLFNNVQHKNSKLDVNLVLPGIKVALIGKDNEKLVDATAKDIVLKCNTKFKDQILDLSVQDIRIENALPDCESSVMLDRIPQLQRQKNPEPALRLIMDRVISNSFGATLFRQVQLSTCELMLNIEEKLLLKLIELISFRYTQPQQRAHKNPLSHDLNKNLEPDENRKSRYYFDLLKIHLASLQLSVFSSPNITESLQKLRTYLGLKFFSFEDAKLQLKPYFKMNVSKTFKGVFDSVTRFYKKQILDQAPRIVGQQIQNYLRFHLSDLLSTLYDEVYNKLMIL